MITVTNNPTRLRILYAANILGGGVPGAAMILAPTWASANIFPHVNNPAIFGMTGSIWFAIGIASLLGMRFPNLFKGVFLVQMIYKSIWIGAVALPLLSQGIDLFVLSMAIFFALVVAGFGYGLFGAVKTPAPLPTPELAS